MMIKRLMDVVVSLIALIALTPLFVLVGMVIALTMGHPVIYRQIRPGLHCIPFKFYKFRTMSDEHDAHCYLLPDRMRLTGIGRWLRSWSLDELPELWNVLHGDMSLVGPRPLLMQYLDRYTPEQMRRHEVKPGLTGWAQVNGRNAITWEEKFKLDVWYVDHWSLWVDVKIIGMTIWKILKREGINHPGQATMEEFKGTNHEK